MAIQQRNSELVDLLSSEFQVRAEPNFAWKSAVSSLQIIPGLIAAWPMSVLRRNSATDRVRDISGAGYHLVDNNTCVFRYENLIPTIDLNGVNEFLSLADGGAGNWADVTGNESYIATTQRGLFFGGWFKFDDAAPPAAQEILIGKRSNAAGNYSYWLRRENADGFAVFHTSNDGTAITTINSTPTVLDNGVWYFIGGRFDNTANLNTLWVNDATFSVVNNNAVFDGTADFCIGSLSGGGSYLDGRASMCFLSAVAVSDAIVSAFYQQTRTMFNR